MFQSFKQSEAGLINLEKFLYFDHLDFCHLVLFRISSFDIRISNLFSEKQLPTGTVGGLIAIINEVCPSRHDQLLVATSP
jgi:hypothetical protein